MEATSTYANVIYADYGNTERVPVSSLLPIPKALLQHPFQIARCALSGWSVRTHYCCNIYNAITAALQVSYKLVFPGKEQFPTVWLPEVLEIFGVQLHRKVLASVDDFDSTFNLLNITEHSAQGGNNINSIILEALNKSPGKSSMKTLARDTQAQIHGKTQAGSTSSPATDSLSADAVKPQPQSQKKGTCLVVAH